MLVTGESIVVNTKGSVEYSIVNHLNVVTTSNYSDSLKLDEGDRRACVVQFGKRTDEKKDGDYWASYFAWAESEDGVAALYDWLLDVDMSGFDPKGWAMETSWKEQVTDSTRSAMEKWVRDLWEDPTLVLPPIMEGAKVLTPEQLAHAYSPEDNMRVQGLKNNLGKHMQDMGFELLRIKADGRTVRLWAVARGTPICNEEARKEHQKYTSILKGKF
jgi:hypothetical protein